MAIQSIPPLPKFSGEDFNTEEGSFDRWIESFEERATASGWSEDQWLFQLKAHLEKTAEHAVRMLPAEEKLKYESVVSALRKRFRSLDIEELRGLEFHQLMQGKQSVEEIGVRLQKLAHKAFPDSNPKEFDRLLKGRFYQAVLQKWQRKLGAPKATETFEELYARARTLERHDQQFNTKCGDVPSSQPQKQGPDNDRSHRKTTSQGESTGAHSSCASSTSASKLRPKSKSCFGCGEMGHFERDCPKRRTESPGKSGRISALTAESAEELFIQQLEQLIATKRLAKEKDKLEEKVADIGTITGNSSDADHADAEANTCGNHSSGAVGPVLHLEVKIEGHPVQAVVDTGAQSTIISQSLLHQVAQHLQRQGGKTPALELPSVKLFGKSGKNRCQLTITAQAQLQFSLNGRSVSAPVFIHPESEIPCLLGMNVLPHLGLQLVQNEKETAAKMRPSPKCTPLESNVCIMRAMYLPSQKVTVLEAEVETPFPADGGALVFESEQSEMKQMGLEFPDALLTQHANGRVFVPVENPASISAQLQAGVCIGRVTQVLEQELDELRPEQPLETTTVETPEQANVNAVNTQTPERLEQLFKALQLEQGVLTDTEFSQLQQLIRENADVFALDNSELGHTELIRHHVDTGDQSPIKQPVRRVPFVYRDKIAALVKEMEEIGVIKPSSSPWASPVVLVPKKDGSLRFCINYRRLNSVTKKDVYPLPRIDDVLDTLGGTTYFSSLDLAAGYWQIGLDAESAAKSAFITHQGLHEFTRMPFGMCNAPATFQCLMEIVLAGLLWKSCFAYIDDVLVCSRTFADHLDHLRQVFARMRKAGLRLKAGKCLFLREEVPYLGYVVTKQGIKPDPAKTDRVKHYPVPTCVNEVRQFLGLASYYRRFVPNFSRIASPLHSLLKRDAAFHWTQECQRAFDQLRILLVSAPVLAYPQFQSDQPFIVETDASTTGLSAVLAQQQMDGKVHPIAFASRSLSVHEKNYGITELETLGLVWAVKLFRPYILGHTCIVFTDHAACTSLLNSSNLSPKLARWAMAVQEMDLSIRHRSGKNNRVADALSRNPVSVADVLQIVADATEVIPSRPSGCESDIGQLQRSDPELSVILDYLETDILPDNDRRARKLTMEKSNYDVIDGVLYYENPAVPGCWRIAVPKSLQPILLKESHAGKFAGHFSERKVYLTLRTKYWWKGMRADVRRYCRSCLVCVSRKGPGRAQHPPLQPIPVGGPFHMIGVDVLQLPESYQGNKYAVVFMDYFTKWPEVFATANQTAETIARLLVEQVITRHGVPELLLSDRGPNFLSALLQEVCKLMVATKVNTSGYHPQCDGLVEKFNGTLINMLSKCTNKYGRDWDRHLPYLLFAYRVAVQESTQASPFYLLHGREARVPTETALTQPRTVYQVDFPDYCAELVANMSDAWALAHQNIGRVQQKQKTQYDKRAVEPKLKVGDRVMVYFPNQVQGKAWKLARPYFGPYQLLSVTPTNAEVQLLNHPQSESIFVSLDRIRPCYPEMTDELWTGHNKRVTPKPQKAQSSKKTISQPTPHVGPITRSMSRKLQ